MKVKENEYGSDWLKELALASLPIRYLQPSQQADDNTSELLSDTIIVSHPANRVNPSHTDGGLSAPNMVRIDESEEKKALANSQENVGPQSEKPNVENSVQIAPKRGQKD